MKVRSLRYAGVSCVPIRLRKAAVSRSRSAALKLLAACCATGPQKMLFSTSSGALASSCGSTFSMSTRGCTMPAFTPSRMLSMACSKITGMRAARFSQSS